MRRMTAECLLILLLLVPACSSNSRHGTATPVGHQVPDSPSNLSGQAASRDTVFLEWWDNAANEEGCRVYRNGSLVGTVGPNAVTFSDTGLTTATTYQYTVRAYNSAGESNPCSCLVKTANPPLNVTLNYLGTKLDHDPFAPGEVRLIVLVTDGNGTSTPEIMPSSGYYPLYDRDVAVVNQRVFSRAAVGNYLKISIMAYEDDDEQLLSNLISAALPLLGPSMGIPDVSGIQRILSAYQQVTGKPLFANEDDYVGCYEGFWSASESWGIGQYSWEGEDDLRLWFSIWTDDGPAPDTPEPSFTPSVVFDGWYVNSIKVDATTKGDTVTANLALSGGEPGQYEIRIGRDISWAVDEIVSRLLFDYDGIGILQEVSFVPAYSTNENGTRGYWVELFKDGTQIGNIPDTYPPRLTVQ